ncbi:MAG: aminodeoxychorismate/anthranilate synthase component II [Deltaproteobacteria bacterium]|nr:aminodeoxychorismate/anthranilate synthase component II [Deltaproteobacteria bacterium]
MIRVFLLDNLDSFTFNIFQQFSSLGAIVTVERGGAALWQRFAEADPTHVVLSPGPHTPAAHPANALLIRACWGRLPLLGICLGMQAINCALGGTLRRDTPPLHGKTSDIRHTAAGLFAGLPVPMTVARYHSLSVDRLGQGLRPIAWTADDRIMAVAHASVPLWGVQFHPESFLTINGHQMIRNFLHGTA